VAQPTDTPERFEVSEPSTALPVPALSRYARPRPRPPGPDTARDAEPGPPRPDRPVQAAATAAEPARPSSDPHRRLDPIVQPASEEWATDPSPPQPVNEARRPGPSPTTHAPALREAPARSHDDAKRVPFWKRIAMVRPHVETQTPPRVEIPKDLLKPAIERIDHLTRRFEREQKALHARLEEFEHNLTRLWELEERISLEEVRAQLAVMRANQEEIADGLHTLARRITIGSGAVVAIVGALLLWLVL